MEREWGMTNNKMVYGPIVEVRRMDAKGQNKTRRMFEDKHMT